jgi:hypothetical protein
MGLPMSSSLSTLPALALAAFVVLNVIQITLAVIALPDLYPRPTSQVVFANKWIWVAVPGHGDHEHSQERSLSGRRRKGPPIPLHQPVSRFGRVPHE